MRLIGLAVVVTVGLLTLPPAAAQSPGEAPERISSHVPR